MKALVTRLAWAVLLVALAPGPASWASAYQPLVGVVHLHSTASTGILSLDEIALQAESLGIDTVVLSDNYQLRFVYSPPPLENLFQVSKTFPSLRSSNIGRYLKDVEDANRRHPKVILIPGVEVVPHYYWTGSPWTGGLTMHDGQKNLLLVGLDKAEDYRSLPVPGNPDGHSYKRESFFRASPLLLVLVGLALLAFKRKRQFRVGGFKVSERRRPWALAGLFIMVGAAWSAYNAPFKVPAFSISDSDAGAAPHQAIIDYINRRGGAAIWSYTEAKDFHEFNVPVMGKFVVKTDPHPEVLVSTVDYTAFGAVYEDATKAETPGREWDQVLEQHCLGKRRTAPWGLGEIGFHGADEKRLSGVLTVFHVRDRSAKGVLEALKSGRMYALKPREDATLSVREFSLKGAAGEAQMGESLASGPGETVTLRLSLESQDGKAYPFQAVLVRNGRAWRDLEGTTPFTVEVQDTPASDRHCTYYRLWMMRPIWLVTNPLFASSPGGN